MAAHRRSLSISYSSLSIASHPASLLDQVAFTPCCYLVEDLSRFGVWATHAGIFLESVSG